MSNFSPFHSFLFQNNVVADDDNSRMIIDQQSQNTGILSSLMVLNLWQQQHNLSAKRHQHPNSGSMSSSRSAKTMEQPRLPNRTITIRDDADVTPIISHQHRHHRTPSINNCTDKDKRINNTMPNSDKNVTCDKVNNCNYYSNEENMDEKLWTLSTTAVPVKLKLLSKFICQEMSVHKTQNANNKNASDIDRNIGSDFQIGKCKNFNVKTRESRGSVYRKTIFWQCCLIFMYIFLLNLSSSTCFAARQEGKCVI